MFKWTFFVGVALIAVGCSLIGGKSEECEVPSNEVVDMIEDGLTIDGATLLSVRASRSIAYEKMWFVGARVQRPGAELDVAIPIWGINDLRNPDFIWWANDRAKEISNLGDEEFFGQSTDGIGRARFCAEKASRG